ncbi:ubiquitin-conjugating enzyme/RWD-like protein [Syncephalis fuscata]|nr:ubiquitin-conjugating enzyme/RWD-like protein [Syncephalis fuscata]
MASNRYNRNSSAVRRLLQEVRELQQEPSDAFVAYPLEDNLFEWHFTIRGTQGTAFEDGRYHGRLLLPSDYPFKPPNIILLTPNGRFELHKKICLSITGYHPEYWQPAWGVRTAMLALISFLPTKGEGAIGALDYTDDERRSFAKQSVNWRCEHCDEDLDYMMTPPNKPDEAVNANNENPLAAATSQDVEINNAEAEPANITAVADQPEQSPAEQLNRETSPPIRRRHTRRQATAAGRRNRADRELAQPTAPFGFTKHQWDMAIAVILSVLLLLIARRW